VAGSGQLEDSAQGPGRALPAGDLVEERRRCTSLAQVNLRCGRRVRAGWNFTPMLQRGVLLRRRFLSPGPCGLESAMSRGTRVVKKAPATMALTLRATRTNAAMASATRTAIVKNCPGTM
jgi:hypothetical protein